MANEKSRLRDAAQSPQPWKKWGPYLSERQWGTVREDYSADGNAWNYFTHDQARSRAYRWGEDGLAGISDDHQVLCFALALWNGKDPILKERLFGLTNSEGNHGEDVKEYYYYLDSTPTHSYMKYLYKYPHRAFPYAELVQTNRTRNRKELEYELIDTGIFDDDRYFDVFVEYAKLEPEDLMIRITAVNRGSVKASIHLLPTLWFRNTWSWASHSGRPTLQRADHAGAARIAARHTDPRFKELLADYELYCDGSPVLLFSENETNAERLFGTPNSSPYVKDAFGRLLIEGDGAAVNPLQIGTKAAAHYSFDLDAGEAQIIRLRLCREKPEPAREPFENFESVFKERIREADEFYDSIAPEPVRSDPDRYRVFRQSLAGLLWSKQYFYYDLSVWLKDRNVGPWTPPSARASVRNSAWYHMFNDDIISMPDKWEYPWYAAWDLAFHTIPLASVDPDFAKDQLDLMLRNYYLHPNGQIPAYEWNFGDVNPPVHAWATLRIFLRDREKNNGVGDIEFLKYAFSKLIINFTWWVNRKDPTGNNVFEGGFLGLDNIGVFDRSAPLPTGGHLEQADGTAWMVFFSQQMLQIAVELALENPLYEEFAIKFFEHTMWIAGAMDRVGQNQDEMWDEQDGFFYDVLRLPNGDAFRLKVRSIVGLLPLAATAVFEEDILARLPNFARHAKAFMDRHPELSANVHMPATPGVAGRRMLSIANEDKLRRILSRMLDEKEFLSPYGIRSLSRHHHDHPFVFDFGGREYQVSYLPAESDNAMFGGNSNWRGPIWMPVNVLLYESLLRLGAYYGDSFTVECPTGSGQYRTLLEVAKELGERLTGIFLRNASGKRPVFGGTEKFQSDPHWRDHILFYEYFHGDNGAGLGASHQTGWTGCIAALMQLNSVMNDDILLRPGARKALFRELEKGLIDE